MDEHNTTPVPRLMAGCQQGRRPERCTFPCPHRAADVEAMREMGVDLRPLRGREHSRQASDRAHRFADVFVITLAAIAIVAVAVHAWFSRGA